MTLPKPEDVRITYTSQAADMEAAHQLFDLALAKVRGEAGAEHPLYIDHRPVTSPLPSMKDISPIDTAVVLGHFAAATAELAGAAIESAAAECSRVVNTTPSLIASSTRGTCPSSCGASERS